MMRKTKTKLPTAPKVSEIFISGSDTVMGAFHEFPKTEGLKKNEAEEHFRLGTQLALQEYPDFEGSKEHLLQAITYRPDYWEAYTALGDISRNPNNPSMDLGKAEDSYKQALRIKLDYPQALLGMLNVLIDTLRLDEAEKVYNKLIKEHARFMKYTNVDRYEAEAHPAFGFFYSRKRYLQILKRMADQYYAMRQYKKAIEKFHTILASDSRDIEVRLALGLSYQRNKQYNQAEALYREIIDKKEFLIESSISNYRVWLANNIVYPPEGLFYSKTIVKGPIITAWNNLGVVYMRQFKYDQAMDAFNHIDYSGEAYNNTGVVHIYKGQTDVAKQIFEEKKHFESAFNLALILEAERRWTEAIACWEAYLEGREVQFHRFSSKLRQGYVDSFEPKWKDIAGTRLDFCQTML